MGSWKNGKMLVIQLLQLILAPSRRCHSTVTASSGVVLVSVLRCFGQLEDTHKTLVLMHEAEVVAAAFSPDGRSVATASKDHTARLWLTATGRAIGHPLQHRTAVHAIAFAPDGNTVLTGCQDGTVWLWDWRAGKPMWADDEHPMGVMAVAFSPNGRTVVT
jgi:WD40 repeat protein